MKVFCENPECEVEIDGHDVSGREINGKMLCSYCADEKALKPVEKKKK